jgi:hypothetical protein
MKKKFNFMDEDLIDLLVLLVVFLFLFSYFKPSLLLSQTTTTGGDTASHYYSAYFMKNYLLPSGRVVGWTHGNYAGFPMFQFYFFLPFLAMALMSYLIPLQISFKLISVLGIFLLPIAAYISMRAMKFRFPIPVFSAIFMLPFLFMEANSMWGGNIPSTLAGEFSYSISLALTVLYLGLLYMEIEKKGGKCHLPLIFLLVLITFTHVYTLLFAVLSSAFFLLERDREKFIENLVFLFKIYFIAFLLVGFWAIPMVWKLSYTTPFAVVWDIKGLTEVFPSSLQPFYFLALFGLARSRKDERILFLLFSILSALFLYGFSTKLGIVDIRFVPFIQLYPLFISGFGLSELTKKLRGDQLLPLIAITATIIWINQSVAFIPSWIEWNYEGFENKNLWESYKGVNEFLKGSPGDPRVVYEHSQLHNSAGSSRAFESLPLFSGRGTLEGLYMQSTVSSPFIFYIQSEISKATSCPFPQWPCTNFDSQRAAKHLELFNVKHVIAREDETKEALKKDDNYDLKKAIGPYDIYELVPNRDRYVVVPEYEPVLFETDQWKEISYLWFMNMDLLEVPIVFTPNDSELKKEFEIVKTDGRLRDLPKKPVVKECLIEEEVFTEEIRITTNCIGTPHIVKVTYFPNWRVEGADAIYLVSPSFMLVYPELEDVRIYYGRTFIDNLGIILTAFGLIILFFERKIGLKVATWVPKSKLIEMLKIIELRKREFLLVGIASLIGIFIIFYGSQQESSLRDDNFGMELALAAGKYTICDSRIKNPDIKEECFKEVGIATNDYNLCDVRIKNPSLRDTCFKEIGIQTHDYNLCAVKIKSQDYKDECFKEIGIDTSDLNLCLTGIMSEKLKAECVDKIK